MSVVQSAWEKQSMESEDFSGDDSCSDASSHPYFEVRRGRRRQSMQRRMEESSGRDAADVGMQVSPIAEFGGTQNQSMQTFFGAQLQEMVVRALMQSTASLVGSSSGVLHHAGEASIQFPNINEERPPLSSAWNEMNFRKAEARRRKKADMLRTSAGEESDSQQDFPLPENCTAEQKALRTRRLNRWRSKRANDLTSNRKAVKKLPYVIHVDGMSKPRGIHRHKWKVAVRGQCGRLDPSMDNINHHPKHVVDSLWHALEKEWEFEGFAHKAREMFEKSATKFMRNKKMQLKYKCQQSGEGRKPDDVSDAHWQKIVELTRKAKKNPSTPTPSRSAGKDKGRSCEDGKDQKLLCAKVEAIEDGRSRSSSDRRSPSGKFKRSDEDDVDAQIRDLRSQLFCLENSRKSKEAVHEDFIEVPIIESVEQGQKANIRRGAQGGKENRPPSPVSRERTSKSLSGVKGKTKEAVEEADEGVQDGRRPLSVPKQTLGSRNPLGEGLELNKMQMECGDIVSMTALRHGKEEEIGKGILMGLAGSKLSRKVIPEGWCSVKVSSYNAKAGSESCPFPNGWKDHIKQKTLREAEGRMILWEESMLRV